MAGKREEKGKREREREKEEPPDQEL